jgi:hypothetical protein
MLLRLVVSSCALLSFAFADTIYLRSGATIQGNYAGGDTRQVKMMVGDHVETYSVEEVLRLEFGGSPEPAPAPTPPPEAAASDGIEIPVGTNLVIRLIDAVDSEQATLGQTFKASIDEPIVVNGQTVIPRGADAVTKLVEDKESGKFAGKTILTLALQSVMINAKMVDVKTSEVTRASGSQAAKTAKTVGGGAAGGAILGGVLGGGAGAAIGAVSGAGLGAGVNVLTKGQKVKIPSETRLSFLLQQALHI